MPHFPPRILTALLLATWVAVLGTSVVAWADPPPIDVNTATTTELEQLPGIGPSKAAEIVRMRERRPFRRLVDLLRVRGIGRRTLARLAPFVVFAPPGPGATPPAPPAPPG